MNHRGISCVTWGCRLVSPVPPQRIVPSRIRSTCVAAWYAPAPTANALCRRRASELPPRFACCGRRVAAVAPLVSPWPVLVAAFWTCNSRRLNRQAVARSFRVQRLPRSIIRRHIIQSGLRIPYETTSAEGTKTEFVDASISLKVTPHVTPNDFISMKITATKNEADFSRTSSGGAPTISTREATTEMLVRDGDTVVIGGLYRRNLTSSRRWRALPVQGAHLRVAIPKDPGSRHHRRVAHFYYPAYYTTTGRSHGQAPWAELLSIRLAPCGIKDVYGIDTSSPGGAHGHRTV